MANPWLILLHGLGGDDTSMAELQSYFEKRIPDAAAILLQGPVNFGTERAPAFGWFDPPQDRHRALDDPHRTKPNGLAYSANYIHSKLRTLTVSGICSEDIHLIGHSQGGAAAITSALIFEGKLGSVSTIAGYLSLDDGMTPTMNGTHYHLHHSLHDDNVSVEWMHYAKEYIQRVGCKCDARCWDIQENPHGIHIAEIDAICDMIKFT